MQKPSSTITAATLAGMATALLFKVLAWFGVDVGAEFAAEASVFVSALVGYFKRENVLRSRIIDEQSQ